MLYLLNNRYLMHNNELNPTGEKVFNIFIEGKPTFETTIFAQAVIMLVLSYWVFDLDYPKTAALTLEFLQR